MHINLRAINNKGIAHKNKALPKEWEGCGCVPFAGSRGVHILILRAQIHKFYGPACHRIHMGVPNYNQIKLFNYNIVELKINILLYYFPGQASQYSAYGVGATKRL